LERKDFIILTFKSPGEEATFWAILWAIFCNISDTSCQTVQDPSHKTLEFIIELFNSSTYQGFGAFIPGFLAASLTSKSALTANYSRVLVFGLGNHKKYSGTGSSKPKELHFASSSLSREG
jgi:hypothetical protein